MESACQKQALLIMMCALQNRLDTASSKVMGDSERLRSRGIHSTPEPASRKSLKSRSSSESAGQSYSGHPVRNKCEPNRASFRQIEAPIPRDRLTPVTIATCPCKFFSIQEVKEPGSVSLNNFLSGRVIAGLSTMP